MQNLNVESGSLEDRNRITLVPVSVFWLLNENIIKPAHLLKKIKLVR